MDKIVQEAVRLV